MRNNIVLVLAVIPTLVASVLIGRSPQSDPQPQSAGEQTSKRQDGAQPAAADPQEVAKGTQDAVGQLLEAMKKQEVDQASPSHVSLRRLDMSAERRSPETVGRPAGPVAREGAAVEARVGAAGRTALRPTSTMRPAGKVFLPKPALKKFPLPVGGLK